MRTIIQNAGRFTGRVVTSTIKTLFTMLLVAAVLASLLVVFALTILDKIIH